MMNTLEHGPVVNDDMREIDWVPEGDIKLRPRTFGCDDAAMLIGSPALFARKFDEDVDSAILAMLEQHLRKVDANENPSPHRTAKAPPDALVAA
jgi:hypothetical protein